MGLLLERTVEHAGQQVGVDFNPRIGVADRRRAQVHEAGRRGAEQHDLALELFRFELAAQGVADRQVGEAAAFAPVGDQRGDVVIDRDAQFAARGRQFKPFDAAVVTA